MMVRVVLFVSVYLDVDSPDSVIAEDVAEDIGAAIEVGLEGAPEEIGVGIVRVVVSHEEGL